MDFLYVLIGLVIGLAIGYILSKVGNMNGYSGVSKVCFVISFGVAILIMVWLLAEKFQ